MRWVVTAAVGAMAVATMGAAPGPAQTATSARASPALPPTLLRHLQAQGFTAAELAAVVAGRAVARGLPRAERDEAGAIGVVRIDRRPEAFLARFRDIVRFERGGGVASVGRFSTPATPADLEGYTMPPEDQHDVAGCGIDDCDINLSAASIERLRRANPRGPGAAARLTRATREALAEYVADYQRRGNDALAVYRDREPAFSLREASARLLAQAVELRVAAPPLLAYLARYRTLPLPPGGEEFFYWSVMTFGMKPITRANHVVLMPVETDGLAGFVAVSRTLYASHYFRDGLEVKWVVPVSSTGQAFYLVSVNRSHSESLMGLKGMLLGGKIRSSARSGVERHILHVKRQAERDAP